MTVIAASQQFQRAVRGLPFMAVYTFGLNDEALPDVSPAAPPAVSVTNAAGAVVITGASTLGVAAGGQVAASFVIPASDLPARDLYTVMWSYTVSTVPTGTTSTIDVCDGRLFPLSDYLNYPELAGLGKTTAQLEEARIAAEDRLEWECGCAFTGRYGTEDHLVGGDRRPFDYWQGWGWGSPLRGDGLGRLALERPFVQTLRGISRAWVDPDDSTSGTHQLSLNYARLDTRRCVVHYRRDPTDQYGGLWGDLTIAYEHGQPVADVRRICAMLARHRLLHGPLDARATQAPVEGGGSINLATPGLMGSVFGIPEIDVFIQRHNQRGDGYVSSGD
jgi:hypothetical protein